MRREHGAAWCRHGRTRRSESWERNRACRSCPSTRARVDCRAEQYPSHRRCDSPLTRRSMWRHRQSQTPPDGRNDSRPDDARAPASGKIRASPRTASFDLPVNQQVRCRTSRRGKVRFQAPKPRQPSLDGELEPSRPSAEWSAPCRPDRERRLPPPLHRQSHAPLSRHRGVRRHRDAPRRPGCDHQRSSVASIDSNYGAG